ncbi:MAG: asparagine synthase-related protein [Parabacteroides distasonis]
MPTRSSAATFISTKHPMPVPFTKRPYANCLNCIYTICLRANKSLAAWGVEGRVPFLDKEFLDVAMQLDPRK